MLDSFPGRKLDQENSPTFQLIWTFFFPHGENMNWNVRRIYTSRWCILETSLTIINNGCSQKYRFWHLQDLIFIFFKLISELFTKSSLKFHCIWQDEMNNTFLNQWNNPYYFNMIRFCSWYNFKIFTFNRYLFMDGNTVNYWGLTVFFK